MIDEEPEAFHVVIGDAVIAAIILEPHPADSNLTCPHDPVFQSFVQKRGLPGAELP